MDSNPIRHPSSVKKWNPHFWIMFNFWWLPGLFNELKPHLPTLSGQKNEMLIFVLQSTSDLGQTGQWTQTPSTTHLQPIKWNACFWITLSVWWLAGLVDGLKPHLPPLFSQKMKWSFLDYVQLLMISRAVQWTQTPSANHLRPKKWNAHFGFCWTSDDQPGWSMDSNPIHHPSPSNKMKCFFLDCVHFWWSARLVDGLKPHLPPLSSQ